MKDVKVIFLDLYKTLVFMPSGVNPYTRYFSSCGLTGKEDFSRVRGIMLTQELPTLDALSQRIGINTPKEAPAITEDLNKHINQINVFDDVFPTLEELKRRGFKIVIVSNVSTPYKTPVYLLGIDILCDDIIFSCEVGMKKPDKDIFVLACDRMSIKPRQGLMVGDSMRSDYLGATNAGMNALLLNRSGLESGVPNIKSLHDLLQIF